MNKLLIVLVFCVAGGSAFASVAPPQTTQFIALYDTQTALLKEALDSAPIRGADKLWIERQHRAVRLKAEMVLEGPVLAAHLDWLNNEFQTLHEETAALVTQTQLQRLTQVSRQLAFSP